MLQFFRNMFKSKVGVGITFGLLALIAIAFVTADVTGSGNFGSSSGGGDGVATVGKEQIDSASLSQGATAALENVRQQNPTATMKAFLAQDGLDSVLEQIIDRTALSAFGKLHGLIASDRLVDSEITKIGSFKGPDGKFSETMFRQALQQQGVSEALVRDDFASGLIARQILVPAAFGSRVPLALAQHYAALLREKREGAIGLLPSAAFAPKAPPSDAELSAFYARKRDDFMRPERRVVRFAIFGDTVLKDLPAPTDAELLARYNANKAQYAAVENRKVTQLIVPTEAAARAILAEVAKGASLEKAASTKGLSAASLGSVSRSAMTTQGSVAVADAAFAAASGTMAAPARSNLGWHVIRVDAIEKKAERSLADVRTELTQQVTAEKRRTAINDLSAGIEEQFDEGLSLTESAKRLGIAVISTDPITADGKVYGKPELAVNAAVARIVPTAFAMEKEGEPQLAEVEAGKVFIIFDVSGIQPSAPAPLAEIKPDVIREWMLEKGAEEARKATAAVLDKVRKGGDLGAALAALGRQLPPVDRISLGREELARLQGQVPPPVALMFSMAKGTAKSLKAPNNRGWYVVALKDIVPGKLAPNDPLIAAAAQQLGEVSGREYAESLRRAVRKEVGVEKNSAGIRAVRSQLGGGN